MRDILITGFWSRITDHISLEADSGLSRAPPELCTAPSASLWRLMEDESGLFITEL